MSSLVKSLKSSLTNVCRSLLDFGVRVQEIQSPSGACSVEYVRGLAKQTQVIAQYENKGLRLYDPRAPRDLIAAHSTMFQALMECLRQPEVTSRPLSAEDALVQRLKVELLSA